MGYFNTVIAETNTSIPFLEESFQQLARIAKQDQKPFFVHFYTEWSIPCKNMEDSTFTHADVVQYVKANYHCMRINAEAGSDEVNKLLASYKVLLFPMVIFFNPEGKVVHSFTGYKNDADFLQLLRRYNVSANNKAATPTSSRAQNPESTTLDVTDTPVQSTSQQIKSKTSLRKSPIPVGVQKAYAKATPKVATANTNKYVVQTGVFSRYTNVLAEINKLEYRYSQKAWISAFEIDGKTAFKVMVGPFSTIQNAQNFSSSFTEREKRATIVKQLSR